MAAWLIDIRFQVTISSVENTHFFYSSLFRRISREMAYYRRNYHHNGTADRFAGHINSKDASARKIIRDTRNMLGKVSKLKAS